MSENKEIKINDTVYYSSPIIGTEGSVLKVKVKSLDYLVSDINIGNDNKRDFSDLRFAVEVFDVIIQGEKGYMKNEIFTVVEDYLYHNLDDAIESFNKKRFKKINLLKSKLANQKKILSLLEKQEKDIKISYADTEIINVRGQDIKALKDLKSSYYTFFEYFVEKEFSYDEIESDEQPIIFEVKVEKEILNPKKPEFFYYVEEQYCFLLSGKKEYGLMLDFHVNDLSYLYKDFESALKGLKMKVINYIKEIENKIILLE